MRHSFSGNKSGLVTQVRLGVDVDDGGQQEGQRLPRASLSQADQVPPLQGHGPPLALNGGRSRECRFLDLCQDILCREEQVGQEGRQEDPGRSLLCISPVDFVSDTCC